MVQAESHPVPWLVVVVVVRGALVHHQLKTYSCPHSMPSFQHHQQERLQQERHHHQVAYHHPSWGPVEVVDHHHHREERHLGAAVVGKNRCLLLQQRKRGVGVEGGTYCHPVVDWSLVVEDTERNQAPG